jgi:hypothetical protein
MIKKVKATEKIGILITHMPTGKTWDTELTATTVTELNTAHGSKGIESLRVEVEDLVDGFITLVSIPVKILNESTISFEPFEIE